MRHFSKFTLALICSLGFLAISPLVHSQEFCPRQWQPLPPLPDHSNGSELIRVKDYVYVFSGKYADEGHTGVLYAPIECNRWIGNWIETTSRNLGRFSSAVVEDNGYLYLLGGLVIGATFNEVEYAKINPDGSLGPWQLANPMIDHRGSLSAAVGKTSFKLAEDQHT